MTYTVKKGDTLYSIAKQYNVSAVDLANLNNVTPNTLQIGQVLRIPESDTGTSTSITYTVKKGDSLYSIAKQYNVSTSDIVNLNNLSTSTLQIGQVLKIPGGNTSSDGNLTYTVKIGDTLYGISNQFGVSATDLAKLNNVTATTLQVGQVLKIPASAGTNPGNLFVYTVKKGDSLYSIAKRYNTTVDQIIRLNNLTTNSLSIGQTLRIPETYTEEEITMPMYINYTVKKGDSLYSIAKEYNLTVDQIIKDNNLSTNTLQVGQNLKIRTTDSGVVEECFGEDYTPPATTTDITYTVKKGDSLYSIAKKYNTSVDSIKRKNNLTSNSLSIGQVIKI